MDLDELRKLAAKLFPKAVEHSTSQPGTENAPLAELKALCWQNFQSLGFDCMAQCFDAVVPQSEGHPTLEKWSDFALDMTPWTLRVRCRAFHISSRDAHIELHHKGPLPGVTETGYRSMFVPMATFADTDPEGFVRKLLAEKLPRASQMELF